jgi:hypothetical protein
MPLNPVIGVVDLSDSDTLSADLKVKRGLSQAPGHCVTEGEESEEWPDIVGRDIVLLYSYTHH